MSIVPEEIDTRRILSVDDSEPKTGMPLEEAMKQGGRYVSTVRAILDDGGTSIAVHPGHVIDVQEITDTHVTLFLQKYDMVTHIARSRLTELFVRESAAENN